jgi:hypothetical protein
MIPLNSDEMVPCDGYMQYPEFANYPYEQFHDQLNDLKNKIKKKKVHSTFDMYALEHDPEGSLIQSRQRTTEASHDGNDRKLRDSCLNHDIDNSQTSQNYEALSSTWYSEGV